MNLSMGMAFGLAAGLAGAVAWAAVAMFLNLEIGWLAWGIGALVGAAVAKGASIGHDPQATGTATGPILGVVAVVITLLSICGGKYALVETQIQQALAEIHASRDAFLADGLTDESLVSYRADDIGLAKHGEEWRAEYEWPEGIDPSQATTEAEYPAALWAEASEAWQGMAPEEQDAFKEEVRQRVRDDYDLYETEFVNESRQTGFLATFGATDLLFFGLGVVTAWGIAAAKSEEPIASTETPAESTAV